VHHMLNCTEKLLGADDLSSKSPSEFEHANHKTATCRGQQFREPQADASSPSTSGKYPTRSVVHKLHRLDTLMHRHKLGCWFYHMT